MAQVRFSVSFTTRPPRETEKDGVDYRFINRETFQSLVDEDAFLEWAEVHNNCYGTSGKYVDDILGDGDDVILDIDVQGAKTIREKRPDTISVFVLPPSYEALRERLERRNLDTGVVIEHRLKRALNEILCYEEYDYLIVNQDLGASTRELESIISGSRCRRASRIEAVKSVLATFGGMNAKNP